MSKKRLPQVLQLIERLAAGELDARVEAAGNDDDWDSVIQGLNQLAEKLRATTISREQLDRIVEHAGVGLMVVSRSGSVISANPIHIVYNNIII